MKPRPRLQPESKGSKTPNVDAVRFDSAVAADAAFERFKDFTRRLIAVPKASMQRRRRRGGGGK